jgi:hypothetical protein
MVIMARNQSEVLTVTKSELINNPGMVFFKLKSHPTIHVLDTDGSIHAILSVPRDIRPTPALANEPETPALPEAE